MDGKPPLAAEETSMRVRIGVAAGLLIAGMMAGFAGMGRSQQNPSNQPSAQSPDGSLIPNPRKMDTDPVRGVGPERAGIAERQAIAVNNDRQKKLVADTEKLLALATELKTDVAKSTKDTLSLDVVRKADEIEKLAHNVKERMKD